MSIDRSVNIDPREYEGATIGGRYCLKRFLKQGGFGMVFRASHRTYGVELREVAIKIAKQPMSDGEARRRFQDALEMARMADSATDAALREHFVTVHDAGRCPDDGPLAGHPYVVMEYVPLDLNDCLKAGAVPLTRAINYFDQILRAVEFIHRQGQIHRDLKPSNILVVRRAERDDLLKVADFGLLIAVSELLGWARSGGDLAYLAPESFSHDRCTAKSDVYMLGLVFYEMLAGRNPFDAVGKHLRGSDEEKKEELRRLHLRARQLETFPKLDDDPELKQRPMLRQVIRGALEENEDLRPYRNAGELQLAWQQAGKSAGSGSPSPEPPETRVERLTGDAKQCFAVGDRERGDQLLEEALYSNRDTSKMPKPNGACYLLAVERRLAQGRKEEASALAGEGYQRRKCASTCRAMALYYEAVQSVLAARFHREAEDCPDRT